MARPPDRLEQRSRAHRRELPATLAALRIRDISYRHAQKVVDHALSLPAEVRARFEEAVLSVARGQSVAKLERRARVVREQLHPCSTSERHLVAREDRYVTVQPARDGMA